MVPQLAAPWSSTMEDGAADLASRVADQHSCARAAQSANRFKHARRPLCWCRCRRYRSRPHLGRDACIGKTRAALASTKTITTQRKIMKRSIQAELILHNGRITTLDPSYPEAKNLAIKSGRIVGVDDAEDYQRGPATKVIDLQGRRVIPGLNDSHLHVIRGGLNYNMELRWDGVPSLADGLRMLKEQAQRPPPG